jgi:hypothetical protein
VIPVRAALLLAILLPSWLMGNSDVWAQVSFPIVAGRPAESRAERILSTRTSLVWQDTTIEAFAAQLRQQFGIDVWIDVKALDDVGIDAKSPLTAAHMDDVVLEEALDIALDQLELTIVVRDELLVITTPEEADSQLATRVYPVGDLVSIHSSRRWSANPLYDDFDTLINLITSTLSPESWEDVGGAGAIEEFPGGRSLVISATREVHRQVHGLLGALRSARRVSFPGSYREIARASQVTTSRPYRSRSREGRPRAVYVDGQPASPAPNGWQVPPRFE